MPIELAERNLSWRPSLRPASSTPSATCAGNSSRKLDRKRPRYRPLLETLEDRITPDTTGPRILSFTPNEVRNATFDHIDVQFNESIDADTFTAQDVSVAGLNGNIPVTSVDPRALIFSACASSR